MHKPRKQLDNVITSGALGAISGPARGSTWGNTRLSRAFWAALPSTSDRSIAVNAAAPIWGLMKEGAKIRKFTLVKVTLAPFAAYTVTPTGIVV